MLLNNRSKRYAFTLVELLFVMAVVVALIGLGVPLIQRMYARNQLKSTTQEVQSLLYRTRLEAMKSGKAVVFRYRYDSPVYEVLPKELFDRRKKSTDGLGAIATGAEMLEESEAPESEVPVDVFERMLPHNIVFGSKRTESINGEAATAGGYAPSMSATSDDSTMSLAGQSTEYDDPFAKDYGTFEYGTFELRDPESIFDDGWSPPIIFFPNGRTSQATLELRTTGRYNYHESLFLRGLTGTAGIVEQ